MRKIYSLIVFAGSLFCLIGCEQDLPVYDTPECHLNFYYSGLRTTKDTDSIHSQSSYSFIYGSDDVKSDTIWFEVETMGFVSDEDRPIQLVQLDTVNNAVPDVHYVSFTNPSIAGKYVMPAGKARTRIPVVVLRDASLKQGDVNLCFTFGNNGYFSPGYPVLAVRNLIISDLLSRPSLWDYENPTTMNGVERYYGKYGRRLHQFMIDETGEKWDDEYTKKIVDGDNGYFTYLFMKLGQRLKEVNAERQAQGLDVLREDDGTAVFIYTYY